jgi:ferric-dicitrate binding protein FerR (iron transport regulator)
MLTGRNKEEFLKIVNKYVAGTASNEEILFLELYYNHFEKDDALTERLTIEEKETLQRELQNRILDRIETEVPVVSIFKRTWFRLAAAAVIILVATGSYLLLNRTNNEQSVAKNPQPVINDITPGGNKAILTLADNTQIILDSAANGTLTQQGNAKVSKLDNGQLTYNSLNEKPTEIIYNTVTTPRGGQYQLTLSDGSKVWLNAASSLRFPASFVGKERKVELTGEAYFEVAKNASMPFKVDVAGKGEVEVLGTHFNINSYADEATINTTLLEGKVKVSSVQNSQLLIPGQQAQLNAKGQISLNRNPDIEEVIAWKNGKFQFGESADIATIMRQISRWYDVDVEYKGTITDHFGGTISRNVNVSKVFEMLEMTGSVKFQVEGKKVIVMPQKK